MNEARYREILRDLGASIDRQYRLLEELYQILEDELNEEDSEEY